jgi:RNA polymerase sigma-70 factor (ECF subfamily)
MQHALAFGDFPLAPDFGRQRHLRAVDRHLDVFLLHPGQIGGDQIGAIPLAHVHLQPGCLERAPGVVGHRAHEEAAEQVVHNVIERIKSRNVGHESLLSKSVRLKWGYQNRIQAPLSSAADFRTQVEALRPYLLRYATLQLRDAAAAEDAVQEALLAALAGEAGFGGRSNLRTWLTGILKHKIVDTIRRQNRERPASDFEPGGDTDDFEELFDRRGHWREPPEEWQAPEGALGQKQFLAALEACLRALPERTARVFMMREHLGLETPEICKELGISATHCWVMLHRARMALRLCLEKNWFAKT